MPNDAAKPFKHYLVTRFNIGLYSSNQDHEQWMMHRTKLFINITVPSIIAQTCQNFTWLVLIDPNTPQKYRDLLEALDYKNLKLVSCDGEWTDKERISVTVLKNTEVGDYDLMTTRIDNDDALSLDMIEKLHYWHGPKPEPWMISFPFGAIMDIDSKEIFPMQYSSNHFPTLIENSVDARTVMFWDHYGIDVDAKEQIYGSLYWLQVVHSKNLDNSMEDRPSIVIMRDKKFKPVILKKFGIDPETFMNIDFENLAALDAVPA